MCWKPRITRNFQTYVMQGTVYFPWDEVFSFTDLKVSDRALEPEGYPPLEFLCCRVSGLQAGLGFLNTKWRTFSLDTARDKLKSETDQAVLQMIRTSLLKVPAVYLTHNVLLLAENKIGMFQIICKTFFSVSFFLRITVSFIYWRHHGIFYSLTS